MGIVETTLLTNIVFPWSLLTPLIERDDGRTINEVDETSQEVSQQVLAPPETYAEVYY